MIKKTVSIKLIATHEQAMALSALADAYAKACNAIVPLAVEHR
jgi:hypothetical protein